MKFSCEKALLQQAINTASHAVASKSTNPALEGILLCASHRLTATGYNSQIGIRTEVEAHIAEPGSIVLNSRLFGDIIRRMPDDVIYLSCGDALQVKLSCGDAAFEIPALSAEDFPQLPEVEDHYSFSVPQITLRNMIGETSFAISTNEARPVHTGSLFEIQECDLTIVSIDGFRLALRRETLEKPAPSFSFVAPGSALNEVEKICGLSDEPAVITMGNRHLLFEIGSTQLICRRLEGEFLDYRQAVPKNNPIRVTVDTKSLTESIERVSVVITEKQKCPVRCTFGDNQVRFHTKTANGEATDICPVEGDGSKLEIGMNHRYLLDVLKYMPADKAVMELNTSISPCLFTPVENDGRFLYMVLPIRLKN